MWIIPSRGRPEACQRVVAEMVAHGMKSWGIVVINEDDDMRQEYFDLCLPIGWRIRLAPTGTIGAAEAYRLAYREFPQEEWYGVISDDHSVKTDGFEDRLVSSAGKWNIASSNDMWQSNADIDESRMHGATIFGGEFVRALGYIAPKGFNHLYVDDVWETIGRTIGNWSVLMDVITPHNHAMKNGEQMDETTSRVNSSDMYANDGERFQDWLANEAKDDINRAMTALFDYYGLSLELARSRSVMICTPCYREVSAQYAVSLMETAKRLNRIGIKFTLSIAQGNSNVTEARNGLVNSRFLPSKYTDLLFIDADMGWNSWDVIRLIATDQPLIAGVGRKKSQTLNADDIRAYCMSFDPTTLDDINRDKSSNIEVLNVGTGFMLINRLVFNTMMEKRPEWKRRANVSNGDVQQEYYYEFFANDLTKDEDSGLYDRNSEDISFCYRWRDLGGEVWVNPFIELDHIGAYNYKSNLSQFLKFS